MGKELKENYYKIANKFMDSDPMSDASLLTEAPGPDVPEEESGIEDAEIASEIEPEADDAVNPEKEEPEENKQIEVYFTDLDENLQKQIMEATLDAINADKSDDFSRKKINEAFAAKPMFISYPDQLAREMGIDV